MINNVMIIGTLCATCIVVHGIMLKACTCVDYNAACAVLHKIGIIMTTITSRKIQQQGKLAKQIEDKLSTAQGDSEVASSKCKMTTVLLSVSLTAFLLFQVVYVVVSLTKLKSGIC